MRDPRRATWTQALARRATGAVLLAALVVVARVSEASAQNCTGDCNGSGEVTVDEILVMVNVALGSAEIGDCTAGDAGGDGEITVDEIIGAVNNALGSCPAATPTRTASPTESATPTHTSLPTATATPTATASATPTATSSFTPTPSASPTPSLSPSPTPSATPSATATDDATPTATTTSTPTPSASSTPSPTPSNTASIPSVTPTETPTATETPSASPSRTSTASPSPTATIGGFQICSSLTVPAAIPDSDPQGISNVMTLAGGTTIADFNVKLRIAHTYVGDLRVTLRHVETGTTVILLDRPGYPAVDGGCSRSNVNATLDDHAASAAHDTCEPGTALIGRLRPKETFSAFSDQNTAGQWELTVSDNAADDTGSLLEWCLNVNVPPSPPPLAIDFTCNGMATCTVAYNQPFMMAFGFSDPDGNASNWRIIGEQDGTRFSLVENVIQPPAANGIVPISFAGFGCPQGNCPTTAYDAMLIVYDATGNASPPLSVHIDVLGGN